MKERKSNKSNLQEQEHSQNGHVSPFKLAKLFDPDASWDKDQLGDVLHWVRQAVALLCGLLWGAIPLVGGIWLILECCCCLARERFWKRKTVGIIITTIVLRKFTQLFSFSVCLAGTAQRNLISIELTNHKELNLISYKPVELRTGSPARRAHTQGKN